MIEFSDFGNDRFVFYNSLSGLYFAIGRVFNLDNDRMEWVSKWVTNYKDSRYFANGYLVKLLSDNVLEESSDERVICMATNFKSIGLCNIWLVPVDVYVDVEAIDFIDCIRLVDILSNDWS